jgi:hypothetical protein
VLERDLWDKVLATTELPGGLELEQISLIDRISIRAPHRSKWAVSWELSVAPFPNLLSDEASSFETGVGGWTAETNCVLTQTFRFRPSAVHGSTYLGLEPLSAADMSALSPAVPVVARAPYLAFGFFQDESPFGAGAGEQVRFDLVWLDALGAVIGTETGGLATEQQRRWVVAIVGGQAPFGAVAARIRAVVIDADYTEPEGPPPEFEQPDQSAHLLDAVRFTRAG